MGSDESSFSVSTISSEVSEAGMDAHKIRAKAKLLKKKLDNAEKRLAEKDQEIKVCVFCDLFLQVSGHEFMYSSLPEYFS